MFGEVRLELDRVRVIIRDEAAVAPDAEGRAGVLVHQLRRPGTGEIAVLKGPFFTCVAGVGLSGFFGAQEGAAVGGDSEEDLAGRYAFGEHVRYRGVAGCGVAAAVWRM